MRLPDPIFRILDRICIRQRHIRRQELSRAVAEQDRRVRAAADALRVRHRDGTCGGAANGCYFVPCVPKVGHV